MSARLQSRPLDTVLSIPHLIRSISNSLSLSDLTRCLRVCADWHALFALELTRRDNPQSFSVRDAFYISPWIYCELDARYPSKTPLTWPDIRRLLPRPWDYQLDEDMDSNFENHGDHNWAEDNNEIDTQDAVDLISCLYSDNDDEEEDGNGNGNGIDGSIEEDANDPTTRSMHITQKLRDRLVHLPSFLSLKLMPGDDPRPHLQEPVLAQILFILPPTIQSLDLEVRDEARDDDEIEQNSTFSFAHHIGKQRDHQALKSLQVEFGYLASSLPYLNWFLLRCCPNLRRLRLVNLPQSLTDMLFEMPELPTLEHCPDLEELTMEGPFNGHREQSAQRTLRTIKKLRVLILKSVRMGSGSQWSAFEGSVRTLESITLKRTGISSATLQAILVNCSGLQHLAIDSEDGASVEAWIDLGDLIESPWMCLSLKTLSLPLVENGNATRLYEYESNISNNESPETNRQLLVRKVYHQLSRLTALESLKICVLRGLDMGGGGFLLQNWRQSTIGLDFSIESGLGILSSLKKLKRLAFYLDQPGQPFRPNLGQEEMEWLATPTLDNSLDSDGKQWLNWPELTEIQLGTLPPAAVMEGQVREETAAWNFLEEHRPEIAVSWASSHLYRVG